MAYVDRHSHAVNARSLLLLFKHSLLVLLCIYLPLVSTQSNTTAPAAAFTWSRYPAGGNSPLPRAYFSAAIDTRFTSPRLMIYGGIDAPIGAGNTFNDIWSYDTAIDEWSVLATTGANLQPVRIGTGYGSATMTSTSVLYLYGGLDETTVYGNVVVFDLDRRTLVETQLPATAPQPPARSQHASFTRSSRVYIFGGVSQTSYLNDFWYYTPGVVTSNAGGTWTQIISTGTPPPPVANPSSIFLLTLVSDHFYVWHGQYPASNTVDDPAQYLYYYSFLNNVWSRVPMQLGTSTSAFTGVPMPILLKPCTWTAVVSSQSVLYMFGGYDTTNGNLSATVYQLDPSQVNAATIYWAPVAFNISNPSVPLTGRRGHQCLVVSRFVAAGLNSNALLMYGGFLASGPTSEMWALNLGSGNQAWIRVRPDMTFPLPRAFHVTSFLATTLYMFGGKDSAGNTLSDFWSATITPTALNDDVSSITWNRITVASATQPSARKYAAMTSLFGQLIMFGGLGPSPDTVPNILGDTWIYNPNLLGWSQPAATSSTGYLPQPRYGHSLDAIGGMLYMFGGILSTGQTSELWSFDPVKFYWVQITPPFTGALWPVRRAFHSSSIMTTYVTPSILTLVQNYIGNISTLAFTLLHTAPTFMFPPPQDISNDPVEEYNNMVTASVDKTIAQLSTLQVNSAIQVLVIYSGNSDDSGGMAVGDIAIFDTLTQLWHEPGGFSALSDFVTTGRHNHVSRTFGPNLFVQGGADDRMLKSAAPMILPLVPNALPGYSFPYSSFKTSSSYELWGPATRTFDGGMPPSVQSLPPSMILSMPAYVFSSTASWNYVGGSNFSVYYESNSSSLNFPANSAWSTVQMNMGGTASNIADSVIFVGGLGMRSQATAPLPIASATNIRVTRTRLTPVCYRTEATPLSQYYGGIRQIPMLSTSSICFMCSPGSRYNNLTSRCDFCAPGYFTDVTGAVLCTPCPAGYFSKIAGGNAAQLCLPCPQGFYNPYAGSSTCSACPAGILCPAGSTTPTLPISTSVPPVYTQQIQPIVSSTSTISLLRIAAIGGGFAFSVLIGLLFLLLHYMESTPCLNFAHFDIIYNGAHMIFTKPHRLSLKATERWKELYETEWKTPLGGCCSIFYIILAFMIGVLLGLPYKYDNLMEIQTLLPVLMLDSGVRTNLRTNVVFTLTVAQYGQSCLASGASSGKGACDSFISNITSNLVSLPVGSKTSQPTTLTCAYTALTCTVTWLCPSCRLTSPAQLVISMQQPLSYGQMLSWSLSTTSGVQVVGSETPGGQLSYLSHSIPVPQPSNYFRGGQATTVNLIASMSNYQSSVATSGNGFVLTFVKETLGSLSQPATFQQVSGLAFAINITLAESFFSTVQVSRLDIIQTIAQISGSILGILVLVGFFMRCCEGHCLELKPGTGSRRLWWKPVYNKGEKPEVWHDWGPADPHNNEYLADAATFELQSHSGGVHVSVSSLLLEMAHFTGDPNAVVVQAGSTGQPASGTTPTAEKPSESGTPAAGTAPASSNDKKDAVAPNMVDLRMVSSVSVAKSDSKPVASRPVSTSTAAIPAPSVSGSVGGAAKAAPHAPVRAPTVVPGSMFRTMSSATAPANFGSGGISATTQLRALSRLPLQPHVGNRRK